MKNRAAFVHPILFAAYPALALFAHNQDEVLLQALATPLLFSVAACLVVLAVTQLLLRDLARAASVTSLAVFLVFSYGHVFVTALYPVLGRHRYVLVAWAMTAAFLAWVVARRRHPTGRMTAVLNVMALVLVAVPAARIVTYEAFQRSATHTTLAALSVDGEPLPTATTHGYAPDIYYIVLDRYPNETTLRRVFDFDNTPFLDSLRQTGFVVLSQARANYATTPLSLASSLNMDYLDAVRERIGEEATDSSVTFGLVANHRVQRLLRQRGYRYVHFGSWWEPTRYNRYADVSVVYAFPVSEFTRQLIETTVAYPLFYRLVNLSHLHRRQVLYKLERFPEIVAMPGPKFIFAHFLVPHPPYVFDRDGGVPAAGQNDERESFLRQLEFINGRMRALLSSILDDSERPPVVILQSDEGPHFAEHMGMGTAERLHPDIVKMKTYILNALYLPGVSHDAVDADHTPVNTFRLVFNEYFGAAYPMLENRSFWFEDAQRPYHTLDVTDVVYERAAAAPARRVP